MPLAHRNNDFRICGAVTVVSGQSSCSVEGELWAVQGDPNSHGGGALINSFTGIEVEGIPVIVLTPDSAGADGLCPFVGGPHCAPATATASQSLLCYEG